jgi:hypothetical protein
VHQLTFAIDLVVGTARHAQPLFCIGVCQVEEVLQRRSVRKLSTFSDMACAVTFRFSD